MKDKKQSFGNSDSVGNKFKTKPRRTEGEEDSIERYKEMIKMEKSVEPEVYVQNLEKINSCRFYMAMLSGCFSGTLCLTGLYGIAFYLIVFLLFSILLLVSLQFKRGSFFLSNSIVLTHGLFSQVMVYVIFWVMFYNLVHIY